MQSHKKRSLKEALRSYINLMDQAEYFEAHEVLEAMWYPLRREQSVLGMMLKGLINGAVAFEHLRRGKPGAEDRARKIIKTFDRCAVLSDEGVEEADLVRQAYDKVIELKHKNGAVFELLVS